MQGNKTAMPTHELHQANAVRVARGLHVGGINRLLRLTAGSVEAERPVEDGDVIVNGLGHTHHGTLVADLLHGFEGLHGALVRAIASQDEELSHLAALHHLGDLRVRGVAAVADQDAAPQLVDVLHGLRGELHPMLILHTALVAPDDAVDGLAAVRPKDLHDLTDDVVQAWAQATTSDNGGRHLRILRIKVDVARWSGPLKLKVGAWSRISCAGAIERLCRKPV
mmetsp:Transcript_133084/g.315456  ORF Transcript_133084/g.315456 Transcript_133084/m.315456 type:complete len:224 (+) Transcript_133084:2430-3101(+)